MRVSLLAAILLAIGLLCSSTGCYYSHLASGQLKILMGRESIDVVIARSATDARTRALLRLVGETRGFARELGLRVGDQYTSYVEWPDDRIVTTIVRTRRFSVEAVPYWYPFLGELPYKGYFDRARAEAEAERLRSEEHYDVCVSGVAAYSTLGWIDDPVTSPMLRRGGANLVETLLHELVHATAFLSDEADFNESVAQFIGQEAVTQFFARGAPADWNSGGELEWPNAERVRGAIEDRRLIGEATVALREELLATESNASEEARGVAQAAAVAATRARLASMPLRELDPKRVAEKARLDNACLALRGTYVRDLPRHAEVLTALGGDLRAMIERLRAIADDDGTPADFYEIVGTVGSFAHTAAD